jgi:poly(A) polymerase
VADPDLYKLACQVVRTLGDRGHEALFVGGWVRDEKFLDRKGRRDIDIATSARPDEVCAIFPRTVPVGVQFGVVLVLHRGLSFEVATFRSDLSYSDGRHPDRVTYTLSAEEDAKRRDFTCNGIFYDPLSDRILDFVQGVQDIRDRRLRAIGDPADRFREDALRMLRAVRFAKELGFSLDPALREAVLGEAGGIRKVSAERIRQELLKVLVPPGGGEGLRLLDALGLLAHILPEVHAMKGVTQPPDCHPEGDVFEHTCLLLDRLEGSSPSLVMAALLHDVGKPATRSESDRIRFSGHARESTALAGRVMRRLKFPKADEEAACDLVRHHMDFIHVEEMRPATLKRLLRRDNIEDHLALHRADCLASHGRLGHYDFVRRKLGELAQEDLRPKPLLTGKDLIHLGLRPGPVFGRILAAVEEAQLDGEVRTKEEARALAQRLAGEGGGAP